MLRRLLIIAAVLVGLLALADRGVATLASSTVAASIQKSEGLEERPGVDFDGFPFITQAVGGTYQRIEIDVRDYQKGEVRIRRIHAVLEGVHLPLGKALSGDTQRIPVDHGVGMVELSYADINEYLTHRPNGLSVLGGTKGVLNVAGTATIAGQRVPVQGQATIKVSDAAMRLVVTKVTTVSGQPVPAAVGAAAASRMSFDLPVEGLPFGITLKSVDIGTDSLTVTAAADHFVITPVVRR